MKLRFPRVRLFGPVLFYELICLARRPRYFILRTLFPIVLLGLLRVAFSGARMQTGELAARTESFFYWFMSVQFLLILLLTPSYLAGAIAEEKDRRRVDFLFATDLENQEIVLDKFVARVANLLTLLLAGLPILSFAQFWGGVDPGLILVGYLALAATVISCAAFSIYLSVRSHRVRQALQTIYLFLFAYIGLSYYLHQMLNGFVLVNSQNLPGFLRIAVREIFRAFGAGNILIVNAQLNEGLRRGVPLVVMLPGIITRYFVFHLAIALGFLTLAIRQVRRQALAEPRPRIDRKKSRLATVRWLKMGDRPVVWKELCLNSGLSFNRVGRILVLLIVLGSFGPAALNLGKVVWQYNHPAPVMGFYSLNAAQIAKANQRRLAELFEQAINAWVRQVGIAVACLTILGVAIRAAGSISGEREQDTLDGLMASPLETLGILWAKWLGSLWSMRWGALWLGIVWLTGILSGGLNLVTLPWLVLAWLIYASFFASLGLYLSVRTNKTLNAMVWTLFATVAISFGQALPWLLLGIRPASPYEPSINWLSHLQLYGFTPPIALGWLSFRGADFRFFTSSDGNAMETLAAIGFGLFLWMLGTLVLLRLANNRLRLGRIPDDSPPERWLEATPIR